MESEYTATDGAIIVKSQTGVQETGVGIMQGGLTSCVWLGVCGCGEVSPAPVSRELFLELFGWYN